MKYAYFTSIFILSFTFVETAQAEAPSSIRLSWQNDPSTTMTITWSGYSSSTPAIVEYGLTATYGASKTGTTGPGVASSLFYQTVELTGLLPNTRYHYRVRQDDGWSPDLTFRTAPRDVAAFSFTAFGDNGTRANSGQSALAIKDLTDRLNADFHLIAGDLAYVEGSRCSGQPCVREKWEEWLNEMERISKDTPVMPALGNHDVKTSMKESSGELFYTRSFALPAERGELYYSFDYGNAHFAALDSNDRNGLKPGGAQHEWLKTDLAQTTKQWKFVYFHHTPYSSGVQHRSDRTLQEALGPVFDTHDVDVVIAGHEHNYQRTYPIRTATFDAPIIASTDRSNYTNPDGTIYITTGGGGRGFYDFQAEESAWSPVRCKCYEVVKITVDGNTLRMAAIGLDDQPLDSFTITKTATGAFTPITPPQQTLLTTLRDNGVAAPKQNYSLPTRLFEMRGFALPGWWHDSLGQSEATTSITNLKATGANWIAISPFWYQNSKTSTRIFRHDRKSPTDASLRSSIRATKTRGLKVMLKPMVDPLDGSWRGQLAPSDSSAWFSSYKDFISTMAALAHEESVDYFVIGTEFTTLTRTENSPQWVDIISKVRERYSGPLTYAGSWGRRPNGEIFHIEFWNRLDAIGVDAYFPLSDQDDPTIDELRRGWQPWANDLEYLNQIYRKPVMFTEVGYQACDGAVREPWKWPCGASIDLQEQADAYEATIRFWADKQWFAGLFFWWWDANPEKGGREDKSYLIQGKPAEETVRRLWSVATTAVPLSEVAPRLRDATSDSVQAGGETVGVNHSDIRSNSEIRIPQPTPYAYGLARRPLVIERAAAEELARGLRLTFGGRIPLHERFWPTYVNAYLYGHYPISVLAKSIRLGGKVAHPSIPYSAWQRSPIYKSAIVR